MIQLEGSRPSKLVSIRISKLAVAHILAEGEQMAFINALGADESAAFPGAMVHVGIMREIWSISF